LISTNLFIIFVLSPNIIAIFRYYAEYHCAFDLKYFPFDVQICQMIFRTRTATVSKIHFAPQDLIYSGPFDPIGFDEKELKAFIFSCNEWNYDERWISVGKTVRILSDQHVFPITGSLLLGIFDIFHSYWRFHWQVLNICQLYTLSKKISFNCFNLKIIVKQFWYLKSLSISWRLWYHNWTFMNQKSC